MPSAKTMLLGLLGAVALGFCTFWVLELIRRKAWCWRTSFLSLVGFVTDFLDTLGIGSYATSTALFRLGKVVPDEKIPGTLTVGHTLPTVAQAFIFIVIVEVDMTTLVLLISASVLGALLGAEVVTRLPRRAVQAGMGGALLAAAALILGKLLFGDPEEAGTQGLGGGLLLLGPECLYRFPHVDCGTQGVDGGLLLLAFLGNFLFGALMTIGVGAYAPIMIMVSLLGMNPKTAFPIMMGSCAFLMPVASIRFIRTETYDLRAAVCLTLAGIPAVLLAAFVVKELPLDYVRWLVVGVVLYTAATMLWAARRTTQPAPSEPNAQT